MRRSKSRTGKRREDGRSTRLSFHSLEPAGEPGGGNVHREAFQGESNKPEIARRRHLEDPRLLDHWQSVVPFRVRPIVPEFPEPAANPAGSKKSVKAPREPVREIAEKRRQAEATIQRVEQQDKPEPHESEKIRGYVPRNHKRDDQE